MNKERWYGPSYNRRKEDPERCVESVRRGNWHSYQCERKRGNGPDGLYCKQHALKYETSAGGRTVYITHLEWQFHSWRIEKAVLVKETEQTVWLKPEGQEFVEKRKRPAQIYFNESEALGVAEKTVKGWHKRLGFELQKLQEMKIEALSREQVQSEEEAANERKP